MKLTLSILVLFLFGGCTNDILLPNDDGYQTDPPEFETLYFDFNPSSEEIYFYAEIVNESENLYIDSVWVELSNNSGFEQSFTLQELDNSGTIKIFSITEQLVSFWNDVYYAEFNFTDSNGQVYVSISATKYLSVVTENVHPEIVNILMPTEFQLSQNEWSELNIELTVLDLNGNDNIQSVKYEIQRIFEGCNDDCIYDSNCNDPIEDSEFISDDTWKFDFSEYSSNGFLYNESILMRPFDGSEYDDGENQFDAKDCGRTGIMFFKFIVTDNDGLLIESDEILLEVTAP
jgi:hypothetical protein